MILNSKVEKISNFCVVLMLYNKTKNSFSAQIFSFFTTILRPKYLNTKEQFLVLIYN